MKKLIGILTFAGFSAAISYAADVNFDVNLKTKQGNTETNISVGNKPATPPQHPVIVKEKTTVIVKEGDSERSEHHDRGKKKGHYKEKHNRHKKHKKEREDKD